MFVCRVCNIDLTSENWYSSFKKRNSRICKFCHNKYTNKWRKSHLNYLRKYKKKYYYSNSEYRQKCIKQATDWQKKHPDRKIKNTTAYMREYMRKYRIEHRDRINEIARVEKNRRRRDLPTDTILNKHFKGAVLYHITPSVAIYIPEKLHKSVSHCLKTEIGMEEINVKAIKWM